MEGVKNALKVLMDIAGPTSKRGVDWDSFSEKVFDHIEKYTVPQYGDKPDDNVESWTADDCIRQIRQAAKDRRGKTRFDQDRLAHDKM